jgi:hydrophobic/amphiphilic exporter-1 (mainly G- bacteria), HAE1 family
MFVDTFIRRPILASVCSLVLILAGAVAIPTMPVAQYPSLAPPQVNVTAIYTGANAQEVETAVTTPLEQAINGAEGMLYMSSSSTNSGISTITVTFDITRDQDVAAVDVQNRVNQTLGRMPADVRTTGITVQKQSTGFIMAVGVFSEKGQYDSLFLSNYLDVYIRDAVKRVAGVGDVVIFGERKYSMRLWLDPDRLAARGLTAGDVTNALREQNVQVAAGSLGQAPAPQGQQYQLSVRAIGRLAEASEFENIILKSGRDGALVRLSDVGRAELGAETYAADLRFQGLEAVGFGVTQLPTANSLDVERAVTAELDRLAQSFPPGIRYQVAFNTTDVVQASIAEVLKTLAEAIILVVLVIFVFLQTWRSTLIPAITIPVSLIGAFAFVKVMGFSINTLTLFGIILATGIVVDDAIVVIENIERHIQEYKVSARKAASDAMREVLGAVVATGLVLIAVFVPVAFFPGTTGRLYAQFSITIAFAVALSVFNAVTLTPALSALLLERGGHGHSKWRIFGLFEKVIEGGTRVYIAILRTALKLRWAVVLVFVLTLGVTYWVYRTVPQAFIPEEDPGYFIIQVQGPAGASLEYTSTIARQAEAIISKDPDVLAMFSVMGFSFSGAASNQGLMFVRLKPFEDRIGDDHSVQAVLGRISGPLFGLPGAIVVGFTPPAIQGLSRFGGFEFQVLDQSGGDIGRLADATSAVVGAGNRSPLLRPPLFSTFTANDPQLQVTIDRQRALALGLPLSEVTTALQIFLGSQYVNDFEFNNRAYRVYVQADQQFRSNPQALRELYARTRTGEMVPLEQVVQMKETTAPQVISHFNLFRSASINGAAAQGVSSGEALREMERLAGAHLPAGMGYAWSGISLEESKAGRTAYLIFGLALLLVYLTLAAQYESLVLPFIVLLGVPIAVLGALSAQWMRGLANDVYCQVGLVMLIGLAAKNAILIVEFAEQLRGRGMTVIEAAIEASRIRLRPILMTSLAFILGVLPLVIATGAGQVARRSVGTTVAGGMFVSTFLNLLFIPVLYVVVQSLRSYFIGSESRTHSDDTQSA